MDNTTFKGICKHVSIATVLRIHLIAVCNIELFVIDSFRATAREMFSLLYCLSRLST